jgi:hypothetical protein
MVITESLNIRLIPLSILWCARNIFVMPGLSWHQFSTALLVNRGPRIGLSTNTGDSLSVSASYGSAHSKSLYRGAVNDLLWADPYEAETDNESPVFVDNPIRGPRFTSKAVENWCHDNPGITKILRAHQSIDSGIKRIFNDSVITIFSAPNYRNLRIDAGILLIYPDGHEEEIIIPHKYNRPE